MKPWLVGISLALSTVSIVANVVLFVVMHELEARVRELESR